MESIHKTVKITHYKNEQFLVINFLLPTKKMTHNWSDPYIQEIDTYSKNRKANKLATNPQ